jgi:hypothetical protein
MRILAITHFESSTPCTLESLEVISQLVESGNPAIALVGVVLTRPGAEGQLQIYVSGQILQALELTAISDGSVGSHLPLANHNGYGIVSIHYDSTRSEHGSFQFGLRMQVQSNEPSITDFACSVYVGSAKHSQELIRQEVWQTLVPIELLRIWLFHPHTLRLRSSQPQSTSGVPSAGKRFARLLGQPFDPQTWGLIKWEAHKLSTMNPFSAHAQFASKDHDVANIRSTNDARLDALNRKFNQLSQEVREFEAKSMRERTADRTALRKILRSLSLTIVVLTTVVVLLLVLVLIK